MSRIDERMMEVCPCGHSGGRHTDLGDGYCEDCTCPEFGAGEQDIDAIIAALAVEKLAEKEAEAAQERHLEAQKNLARLLGRRDDGKDFWFEAQYRAEKYIVGRALAAASDAKGGPS